jgi:hypothetical protein
MKISEVTGRWATAQHKANVALMVLLSPVSLGLGAPGSGGS